MGSKILIVDDEPNTVVAMQAVLEDAGHTVVAVQSGFGVTGVIRQEKPDLVLVDVDMRGLRGDTLVKDVLKKGDLGCEPAIVFHSGRGASELAGMVQKSGADGFIEKGMAPEAMLGRVTQVLASRSAARLRS